MKTINKNYVFVLILCVACFFAGAWMADVRNSKVGVFLESANDYKRELICAYEQYYDATERLLDELENRYNWVDAYDPEPYYIAVERLDTLYAQEM